MTTYFKSNDSSRLGFKGDIGSNNNFENSTQDFTQNQSLRKKNSDYSTFLMSDKNITKEIIGDHSFRDNAYESEELIVSDQSYYGKIGFYRGYINITFHTFKYLINAF